MHVFPPAMSGPFFNEDSIFVEPYLDAPLLFLSCILFIGCTAQRNVREERPTFYELVCISRCLRVPTEWYKN